MLKTYSTIKKTVEFIKNNDEAIARWISSVISPHIVGIVLTLVITFYFGDKPLEILYWLLFILPLVVVPPMVYLFWLVYMGVIKDVEIPKRKDRLRPLAVLIAWFLLCLGLIRYWHAPVMVEIFLVSSIVLVGIMSLITMFWKISFHGATITAAATTTVMVAGAWTWPVILLVPLVGWSRIRLKRHTPRQVIYGSLLGALISLILVHGLLMKRLYY